MGDLIKVVYTSDLKEMPFIQACKNKKISCISVEDARSAVYFATGICAQNKCRVIVCIDAGNASRSAFSGMTEAFYRNLPVVLITIGKNLNYIKGLNDVVKSHYVVSDYTEIKQLLTKRYPMHIELITEYQKQEKIKCDYLQQILSLVIDESTYLYISQEIEKTTVNYIGKVIYGGLPNCYEGAFANVLGASLAKKHNKYIGLVSEREAIHDINTLGNINNNNLLLYIIVTKRKNKLIVDFAVDMKFDVYSIKSNMLTPEYIEKMVSSHKRTILMIYEEE